MVAERRGVLIALVRSSVRSRMPAYVTWVSRLRILDGGLCGFPERQLVHRSYGGVVHEIVGSTA
jgi:hypothetical protein